MGGWGVFTTSGAKRKRGSYHREHRVYSDRKEVEKEGTGTLVEISPAVREECGTAL